MLKQVLRRLVDNTDDRSLATRLRRQRFRILLNMIRGSPGPVRILDIGGTAGYWEMMTAGFAPELTLHVTLLNRDPIHVDRSGFAAVMGDGRAMPEFGDKQFDIVFSNSTIEHVGTLADQQCMAREVQRVGRRFYVQTPNRYFPIEPHFVFPFFQFLPVVTRVWLLRHFALGWYSRMPDREAALEAVTSIRLLSYKEFRRMFPHAHIFKERLGGLVKSFIAYGGDPALPG